MIDRQDNYRQTLLTLRHKLKPSQQVLSHFLHHRTVETLCDALAATVARPSVLLGATTGGVVIALPLYMYARSNGFALQGSEIMAGLLVGAAIGLLVDLCAFLLRR